MKPRSAAATVLAERPHAKPIHSLKLELAGGPTLWLSDRYVGTPGGPEQASMIAQWGTLEESSSPLDSSGSPATFDVALFNDLQIGGRARVSDLLRSPHNPTGYEFAFARASLYRQDAELPPGTEELLGVFYLEDPTEIGARLFRLRMSDISLVLETALRITRINRTEFPSASRAVVGRWIPRPFGAIKNVPAIPVVDGVVGRLSGAHTAATTTITLVDASDFASGDKVLIVTELITLGTKSGDQFTGSTRHTDGTLEAAHDSQAAVFQVRTGTNAYRFVVGEHDASFKTKAISNIRVNGEAPRTSPTVQLDATDVVAGRRFAVISFTPPAVKAFHIDPIQGVTTSQAGLPTTQNITWEGAESDRTWGDVSIPAVTGSEIGPVGVSRRIEVQYVIVTNAGINSGIAIKVGGRVILTTLSSEIPAVGVVVRGSATYETGAYVGPETVVINFGSSGSSRIDVTVHTFSAVIAPNRSVPYESTAGHVIGQVTCDVEGVQDDASGTISGTANLLLENPADVATYMLTRLFTGPPVTLGASWAATRASLAAAGYKWALLLGVEGPEPFSELRRLIGDQARSRLGVEAGKLELRYLPDAPSIDQRLDYAGAVSQELPALALRTSRTQLANRIVVSAQRDYVAGGYRYSTTAEDLTQPGLTDPIEAPFELPWVQDPATADALGAVRLRWLKRPRFTLDLIGWQGLLALEKFDHIAIANHPVMAAHGGEALPFLIHTKAYQLGDENPSRIQLTAIEAG